MSCIGQGFKNSFVMAFIFPSLVDILIYIVFPLAFCALYFRWCVDHLHNVAAVKNIVLFCVLTGVSFLVFQITESFLYVTRSYIDYGIKFGFDDFNLFDFVNEIYDLVLGYGLVYSWTGVTNYLLYKIDSIDRLSEIPLVVQMIYFLCSTLIGFATLVGVKLWKRETAIRHVGLLVLIICFAAYTFGVFFWVLAVL